MSCSPTPAALRVEIQPSNYVCAALCGIAAAALAAIFYAKLTWPLRLLLSMIVLIYSGYCMRAQRVQRGVLYWRSLWFWREANGAERALNLRHSTVWPGLIVLVFRDIERRNIWRSRNFVLTLCADSCDRDSARRLRMHLHHFPVFASDKISD
jgi:hypothetical protein